LYHEIIPASKGCRIDADLGRKKKMLIDRNTISGITCHVALFMINRICLPEGFIEI